MKAFLVTVGLFVVAGVMQLQAQSGDQSGMFSFLSSAERTQLDTARTTAMNAHPELKTEETDLREKGRLAFSPDATPDDFSTFQDAMQTHMKNMKTAMLKVDPTLQPIFDKIDQHMPDLKSRFQATHGAPIATPTAPSGTSAPAPTPVK